MIKYKISYSSDIYDDWKMWVSSEKLVINYGKELRKNSVLYHCADVLEKHDDGKIERIPLSVWLKRK